MALYSASCTAVLVLLLYILLARVVLCNNCAVSSNVQCAVVHEHLRVTTAAWHCRYYFRSTAAGGTTTAGWLNTATGVAGQLSRCVATVHSCFTAAGVSSVLFTHSQYTCSS
jgi:hypothetical protein